MRRLTCLIPILLVFAASAAHAFEAPDIAAKAAEYQRALKSGPTAGRQPVKAQAALDAARRLAKRRRWTQATGEFEKSIGYGAAGVKVWTDLARALSRGRRANRDKTVLAAWLAYDRAKTNAQRADALAYLALGLEYVRDFRRAIKAYRESLGFKANSRRARRLASLEQQYGFRFRSYELDTRDENPRACLVFTQKLGTGRKTNYADYLEISPTAKIDVSVTGQKLCIAGLAYGETYSVTVRPGLPAAVEERTDEPSQITFSIPSRKAQLQFRGRAYILPKTGSRGIPLYSVNVAKATMKVLRINDRNLIEQIATRKISGALYAYERSAIENQRGELVWQGEMDITAELNKEVATAFDVNKVLKDKVPGIYIVTAEPRPKLKQGYGPVASQWVLVSDLGIASFKGTEGLTLFVRSLETARAVDGVELRLYGRNNRELGRAKTDDDGRVRFAPGLLRGKGGNAPAAVMAYGAQGDFNFLDLTAAAFDLTDRGVEGRAAPGPLDAYLYSDRGIYRPGETAHVMALLRDNRATAVPDLPMTVRIFRPDGSEFRRRVVDPKAAGAYHLALDFPRDARTGQWTVRAYADPKGVPVGQMSLQVEDFVPERLAVTLDSDSQTLARGAKGLVRIAGRWLYGAPASGLRNRGELVVEQDTDPYPDHKGYRFGLVNETWTALRTRLNVPGTDKDGRATAIVALPELPDSPQPLKATFRLSMLEAGGRPVTRSVGFKVRRHPIAIGLRPRFEGEAVGRGAEAAFDIIAVGPDGTVRDAPDLRWEIVRERHRYRWYRTGQDWRYRVEILDEPVASGRIAATAAGPATVARSMDWGRYRIEVFDPAGGAATSVRFRAGWFVSPTSAESPDTLELSLDKNSYKPGETVRLAISPPYAGEALVTLASDRLHLTRNVTVPADGTIIDLPVGKDWSGGAYATVTLFRPGGETGPRGPGRAVGVQWIAADSSARRLTVAIDSPDETPSDRSIRVPIAVTGLADGAEAHVTLAAVDEGILSLTDFKSPDPGGHYFGKRALGVELRDAYGRLIDGRAGTPGRIRSGGDAAAAKRQLQGLAVRSTSTVALFSGIVKLDAAGRATIPLDIPPFAGKLRLMAVAFTKSKVSAADKPLLVRDPVVAQMSLPRFLAPGDMADISLTLRNLAGPAGRYAVTLTASGAVGLDGQTPIERELSPGASADIGVRLRAQGVGVGKLAMTVAGPEGAALERSWQIAVRPAQAVATRRLVAALSPDASIRIDGELLAQFHAGTGNLAASFSTGPNFDVPGLLASLDRYPYGCMEQTVSRALPLLYLSSVAKSAGVIDQGNQDGAVRGRIQDAIYRVLDMQRSDGGFALWRSSGPYETWLTAYAVDFLRRARALGYAVPELPFQDGLTRLRNSVANGDFGGKNAPARAYALYVLAKAGVGNIGATRQYYDTWAGALKSPVAKAQLAAALADFGDRERARAAVAALVAQDFATGQYRHYGSPIRDAAASLAMLAESGMADNEVLFRIADWIETALKERRYTSTQEKAWLLLAAHALFERQQPGQVEVNGAPAAATRKPVFLKPSAEALQRGVVVRNTGEGALRQVITATGVPVDDQPPVANGFRITRTLYDLGGKEVATGKATQGELYVVVIAGEARTRLEHKALVVDLLPAGFEIENTRLRHAGSTDDYGWLPKLTPTRHMEFRDDRFAAAIDIDFRRRDFRVAYLVRAVTPGAYKRPAVFIEDMYKPQYHARGAMGRLTVDAR